MLTFSAKSAEGKEGCDCCGRVRNHRTDFVRETLAPILREAASIARDASSIAMKPAFFPSGRVVRMICTWITDSPFSNPLGCDLMYRSDSYLLEIREITGDSRDSEIPTSLIQFSARTKLDVFLRSGTAESRKIAFISEGTPGSNKIRVLPCLASTAGALPMGFWSGVVP